MENLGMKLYILAFIFVPLLLAGCLIWEVVQAELRQRRLRKLRREVIAMAKDRGFI